MLFKWLDKKFTESALKHAEKEAIEDKEDSQRFLKFASKMAKENEIKDAIHTVWNSNSAVIVTEDFLYFYGSSSDGNWTSFHRGEALSLSKIVSVESSYSADWESIDLRFTDGSVRYVRAFGNTRELDRFFKEKAINKS